MPAPVDEEWRQLGKLIEGLAYAQRPIFAAVRGITKRLGLGPRGAEWSGSLSVVTRPRGLL